MSTDLESRAVVMATAASRPLRSHALARVLRVRDSGGSPCRMVRSLAAEKLAQTAQDLAELAARRDALRRTLRDWERRLARTPRGRQARLLVHVYTALSRRPPHWTHSTGRTRAVSHTKEDSP